ncbi:hypothetical protein OKA04_03140 [Luteolibacter flavescens]|uniref:Uncharacterized protein n=1 Tax=Luteolibacter flavescens TaxID=1859460 RepID=A0ABT3FJH1_9BACT|nr:hypothetical protein [Luteolibacter flavescens]MCW1883707.1 hypothetical protein [Luteolibacter flavescens]
MRIPLSHPILLLSFSLATTALGQASKTDVTPAVAMELDYLRSLAEDGRTKAKAPLLELATKYREAIEKIRDDSKAAANPTALMEAEAALGEYQSYGTPDGESGNAAIARLERIYLEQRPKVAEQARPALLQAERSFGQELKRIVEDLTKKGETSQAIAVKEEMDVIAERVKTLQQPGGFVVPKVRAKSDVTIVEATFTGDDKTMDVTRRISELVAAGKDFNVNTTDMGGDPKYWHRKYLKITYTKGGIKRVQDLEEGDAVQVESITGPQDLKEAAAWLIGSNWKSENGELFFKDQSDVKKKDRTGRWKLEGRYHLSIEWSAGEKQRFEIDTRYSRLNALGGMAESFVPAE